jgi:hypothetical protein
MAITKGASLQTLDFAGETEWLYGHNVKAMILWL